MKKELQHVIAHLSPKQPFLSYDLGLSEQDIGLLSQLRVGAKNTYSNFGQFHNLGNELKLFIESLAAENDKISSLVSKLIVKLANDVTQGNQQGESAWVLAKASIASDEFDLPDWHTDLCMAQALDNAHNDLHKCKKNEHYVVFSLKGPSTLFSLLPDAMREEFNFKSNLSNYFDDKQLPQASSATLSDQSIAYDLLRRKGLEKIMKNLDKFSINMGQGCAFLAGNAFGAVHSPPPTHEERLFIAIFPGSKEEVRRLGEKMLRAKAEK